MIVFFYDKTFGGLLSALFDAYTLKRFPALLLGEGEIPPLHAQINHTVSSTEEKAERVFRAVRNKLDRAALKAVKYAWFSESTGSDTLIFRLLRKALESPRVLPLNYGDSDTRAIMRLSRQVSCEKEKMMGFLRFQETAQGIYCATMPPRYNILPLLIPHCRNRFSDQQWIIHDVPRGFGFYFTGETILPVTLEKSSLPGGRLDEALLTEKEKSFSALWKEYYKALAIKERSNPRLQRRCMPKRFWTYLPEKQG